MPVLATAAYVVIGCGGSCSCALAVAAGRYFEVVSRIREITGQSNLNAVEFQEVITFLGSLPLFRKQLPKAELPKVAKALSLQRWNPDEKVIEQGDQGKAFFIIKSGQALMEATRPGCKDTVQSTLFRGDYFGIDSLVKLQLNPATITAKGPEILVTLVMPRETFESLGLARIGRARRKAIGKGHALGYAQLFLQFHEPQDMYGPEMPHEPISKEEEEFVAESLKKSPNLRALVKSADSEAFHRVAKYAQKVALRKLDEVGHQNKFQTELVVVESGTLDVIPTMHMQASGKRSPEAVLSSRLVAQRLVRKQEFLLGLATAKPKKQLHSMSLYAPGQTQESPGNLGSTKWQRLVERSGTTVSESVKDRDGAVSELGMTMRLTGMPSETRSHAATERDQGSPFGATQSTSDSTPGHYEVGARVRRINLRLDTEPTEEGRVVAIEPISDSDDRHSPYSSEAPRSPPMAPQSPPIIGHIISFVNRDASPQAPRKSKQKVRVKFGTGTMSFSADELRPVQEMEPIHTLQRGEIFGELSLLYNARQVATCRVAQDAVVYVIKRQYFKACFFHEDHHFVEYCKLLAEVAVLSPLLKAERQELARNATGLLHFQPGEQVLFAHVLRKAHLWYIVDSGSVIVKQGDDAIATLTRGCHFGERSILKGNRVSDVSVFAGGTGCSAVAFDGDIVQNLPLNLGHAENAEGDDDLVRQRSGDFGVESINVGAAAYVQSVARTACRSVVVGEVNPRNLTAVDRLGQGSFGNVYLATRRDFELGGTGGKKKPAVPLDSREALPSHFALKRMSKGFIEEHCEILRGRGARATAALAVKKHFSNERDSMSVVDSPFVLYMFKSWQDDQFLYLVLELAPGGDLGDILENQMELLVDDRPRGTSAIFYIACIVMGLEHLHERRIAHRDLKPYNVMIGQNGYAKLGDLGFARFMFGKSYTICGSPEYMAPEIIDQVGYDIRVDWWALGVLTYELLTATTPWENVPSDVDDPMECCLAVRAAHDHMELRLPTSLRLAQEFVTNLLCVQADKRLGLNPGEVGQQRWFKMANFDFESLQRQRIQAPYIPDDSFLWKQHEWSPGRSLNFRDEEDENFKDNKSYSLLNAEDYENWPKLDIKNGLETIKRSIIIY